MTRHRLFSMSFARIYSLYIAKVERKGRSAQQVNQIILWLTGYTQAQLDEHLAAQTEIETFLVDAPRLNPARSLITGTICGVRIEAIEDPTMREIRYLDKLIDELANGKAMEKILRA